MNNAASARMLLSIAALAALAALFGGGANAKGLDNGGSAGAGQAITTVKPGMIPYLSHGIGVDESQFATPTSPGFTGVHAGIESRVIAAARIDEKTLIAGRRRRGNVRGGGGACRGGNQQRRDRNDSLQINSPARCAALP